jgi:hypothetical protein
LIEYLFDVVDGLKKRIRNYIDSLLIISLRRRGRIHLAAPMYQTIINARPYKYVCLILLLCVFSSAGLVTIIIRGRSKTNLRCSSSHCDGDVVLVSGRNHSFLQDKLYIENKRYYLNGMELYPNARVEALFDDGHWYPGYGSGFQATRIQLLLMMAIFMLIRI